MIFLLDNYDSFTYNLVQRLGEIDPQLKIHVERNDQISVEEIEQLAPERIIISPGPCTPDDAGISRDVIRHFGPGSRCSECAWDTRVWQTCTVRRLNVPTV